MCSQFSGMCSQLPRAVLPKLWGWGSRCVCAGCYCSASEWLKIAVTIAMATGAVSLCCEGAAWMLELPWWIPGRWRRFWWGLLGAEVIQPKRRLVLTPVRMCLDRESLATVGGSGVGCGLDSNQLEDVPGHTCFVSALAMGNWKLETF